jgi:hypothetical protein
MRSLFLITLFLFTSISCFGSANELQNQKKTVTQFYSTILGFKEPGITSKENIEKLSPFISKEFRTLLLKSLNAEALYKQKTKDQVPPLVESHLFYSLFEGAHSFGDIIREDARGSTSFLVELSYIDPYGKHEKTTWKDRIILIKENGRWVVDNIEFLGDWAFGDKGSVRETLRNVIKSANDSRPD